MNASYFLFFCQDPLSLSLRLPLQFLNLFMSLKFIVLTLTNFNKHQTFISHMSHDVDFVSSCGGYDKETKVC